MKKKYKLILNSTALAAITTVGLSTVVACGVSDDRNNDKKTREEAQKILDSISRGDVEKQMPKDGNIPKSIEITKGGIKIKVDIVKDPVNGWKIGGISTKDPKDPSKTIVSKGKTDNTQENMVIKYKFNKKVYATLEEAKKAQTEIIESKVKSEISNKLNKLKVYKYKGVEYLTQSELFKAFKNDHKIEKVNFENFKKPTPVSEKYKFKNVKQYLEKGVTPVFTTNGKVYKTVDSAIEEYFKHGNGDKSGNEYSKRMYDSKKKEFGKTNAIVGLNKPEIDGDGAKDGKFYVTKGSDRETIVKNQKYGFKLHDKLTDVKIYKKEFLEAIDQFRDFYKDQADTNYTYWSFRAGNQDTKITLPSGKKMTSKFYLYESYEDESGGKKTDIKANTLEKEVKAASSLKDLAFLWNILTTRTWEFKTYGDWLTGYTERKVTFASLPTYKPGNNWGTWGDNGVTHPWFDKYKPNNTTFNFNKKLELNGKWFEDEKALMDFVEKDKDLSKKVKDEATKQSKEFMKKNPNAPLISFKDKSEAPKGAILGLNKATIPAIGDGTGNTYKEVKATSDGKMPKDATAIIGKNYTTKEIKYSIETNGKWINPKNTKQRIIIKKAKNDMKKLKDGDLESTLILPSNVEIGRVVKANNEKSINDGDWVYFNNKSDDELFKLLLPKETQELVESKDKFKNITKSTKPFISAKEFSKARTKLFYKDFEMKYIDELHIEKTLDSPFDDVKIPKITFNGPSEQAKVKTIDENIGQYYSVEYKIRKKDSTKDKNITFGIDEQLFSNGDELVIVIVGDNNNELIRRIKIDELQMSMVNFFKSKDKELVRQQQELLNKIKTSVTSIVPKTKATFEELGDTFKTFLSKDLNKRTSADKNLLVSKILETKKVIDEQIFDQIISNKNSLGNIFVSELNKNNVFTDNISTDGKTIKPKIKDEINDLIDIVRVIIDHTFEFIANSIHWEPQEQKSWVFVGTSNKLDSAISRKTPDEIAFLKKLKADKGTFFKTKEDDDAAFKTSQELMSEGDYKIYKEVKKGKPTIFHLVKDVNSRKINNVFRKQVKFAEFNKKGTIDNFKIVPGDTIDSKIKSALEKAKKRRADNKYKEEGKKTLDFKKLYGRDEDTTKQSAANSYSGLGSILNSLMGLVKPLLKDTIGELLGTYGDMANGLLGITGIKNIIPAFNTASGSLSEFIIGIENNISGLLTHIVGDTGHIVIDIEQDGKKTTLKNYYSPEIRVVDKENYKKIIYRRDDLETFWSKLKKPFMDLLLEVLGSL